MKILFTGGSSFTGYWFIKELVKNGHEVHATFTKELDQYEGVRKLRVDELKDLVTPITQIKFGDDKFLELLEKEKYDFLCHHMAMISGFSYRDMNYDISEAVGENTRNINKVMEIFSKSGKGVVITGTVFEGTESKGEGSETPAYPYALAKTLTSEIVSYYADYYHVNFGKFTIPNPFGPMEEPKFTTYLIKQWKEGNTPTVKTPEYIRDNIHVELLAKVYSEFINNIKDSKDSLKIAPSGYVGKQGEFAKTFASEMKIRLDLECNVDFAVQTEFEEPKELVNTDKVDSSKYDWDEEKAWNEIADFYKKVYL
ncbi:NAD-dependent epimerase/dehydratase family protein [Patescibacteria group bacterium]